MDSKLDRRDQDFFKNTAHDKMFTLKSSIKKTKHRNETSEISQPKIKNIICFSHLRWNFVFQRPQHLLTRWAKEVPVYYIEEPIFGNFEVNFLKAQTHNENITIITPHIQEQSGEKEIQFYLEDAIKKLIQWNNITDFLFWYITPMAYPFSKGLNPKMVVYDCMDELSHFKGAHPDMIKNETALLKYADVVFTGGQYLYEYKKDKHNNIHPFPSSIDQKHFESGLECKDPDDQAPIPHPRVGFFGVIDERLDIPLLEGLAKHLPNIHFVMIGPVVKIDPSILPHYSNIHYLGQKDYKDLPAYLGNWDAAFLPFAKNDSTRFISPTKTPEYLCCNKPVVSTSIRDVVVPYGEMGLVLISDTPNEFAIAVKKALLMANDSSWKKKVKQVLKSNSWDLTWMGMKKIIMNTLEAKENSRKELIPIHNGLLNNKVNSLAIPMNPGI
ncbi:MAG: glycosyltransferase family 1 protein [Bacteroidetes bacterium]|nr:glycosyltransferase family 1 protein [Bacteroidota bacterium]